MPEEVTVTPKALEDMRDVLEEIGYVNAQRASNEDVFKVVAREFGSVPGWLRYYGHL